MSKSISSVPAGRYSSSRQKLEQELEKKRAKLVKLGKELQSSEALLQKRYSGFTGFFAKMSDKMDGYTPAAMRAIAKKSGLIKTTKAEIEALTRLQKVCTFKAGQKFSEQEQKEMVKSTLLRIAHYITDDMRNNNDIELKYALDDFAKLLNKTTSGDRFTVKDVEWGLINLARSIYCPQSIKRLCIQALPFFLHRTTDREVKNFDLSTGIVDDNNIEQVIEQLANFKTLEEVFFNSCGLTTIPSNIGKLVHLKRLSFAHNPIHRLPDTIKKLKLKILGLNFCKFNEIPPVLTEIQTLTELQMGFNSITSIESLKKLPTLCRLMLIGNRVTLIPEGVGTLSELVELDLCHNEITTLPSTIHELKKIEKLALSHNRITKLPEAKGDSFPRLKELNLANNNLDTLPASWIRGTQLTHLWVNNNQLSTIPQLKERPKHLQSVMLDHNRLQSLPSWVWSGSNLLSARHNYIESVPSKLDVSPNTIDLTANRLVKADFSFYHQTLSLGLGLNSDLVVAGLPDKLHRVNTVGIRSVSTKTNAIVLKGRLTEENLKKYDVKEEVYSDAFGVIVGFTHNGGRVSGLTKKPVQEDRILQADYKLGKELTDGELSTVVKRYTEELQKRLRDEKSGALMVASFIVGDRLVTINIGDTFGMDAWGSRLNKVFQSKPIAAEKLTAITPIHTFQDRTEIAGATAPIRWEGTEIRTSRGGPGLQVPRSLGDVEYGTREDFYISPVRVIDGDFVQLLACDGPVDHMSPGEVLKLYVNDDLYDAKTPEARLAAVKRGNARLFDRGVALKPADKPYIDNTSVIVIHLKEKERKSNALRFSTVIDGHGGAQTAERIKSESGKILSDILKEMDLLAK